MTEPVNNMKNLRAPHQKSSISVTSPPPSVNVNANSVDELASVFGSLRVAGSTPSETAPASSCNGEQDQAKSLVMFDPSFTNYHERARAELSENDKTLMMSKILQLSDQVSQLLDQRSDFEEKQVENDRTVQDLCAQVTKLRDQVNAHHMQLEAAKQLLSERSREIHAVDSRVSDMKKNFEQQIKHQENRTNNVGSFAKQLESRVNAHARQLREDDSRINEVKKTLDTFDENDCRIHEIKKALDENNDRINALKRNLDKNKSLPTNGVVQSLPAQNDDVEATEMQKHCQYIKQIGEKLVEHQRSLDVTSIALKGLRNRYETLNAMVATLSGQEGDTYKVEVFKMESSIAAIFEIQSQVDRLEKEIQRKASNDAGSVNSDMNALEELEVKVDSLRKKVREMDPLLAKLVSKQKIMDEVALASRFRLEDIFYSLSSVIVNKRLPEETEFGLEEDEAFMVRQRVLERITVDEKVQIQYVALTEKQEWQTM